MLIRIVSAFVALAVFIPVLIFSDTVAFEIFAALVMIIAAWEILGCVKLRRPAFVIPLSLAALTLPFFVRRFDCGADFITLFMCVSVVLLFYMLSLATFSKGKVNIKDATLAFAMIFYIFFGFLSLIYSRDVGGKYLYLLIFLSAWMTDTGAYFTGVAIGRHKLIPDVSPKKTVEGAIGGVVVCVATFIVFGMIVSSRPDYVLLAVCGLVMSVISMCGDLIASLVKRQYGVKDYGKIMPGHGGIMDRFDSVLATSCFMYLILNLTDFAEMFS